MKVRVIPIVICALGIISKRLGKWTERLINQTTIGDHPDHSIIKTGPNTETGDLMKLAVTQTLLKDHQLILV